MAITKEKAERIAQEYSKTGFLSKSEALRKTGYSNNYSKANGLKLYENVRVKAAIVGIMGDIAAKEQNTRGKVTISFKLAAQMCLEKGDMVGYIRAQENLGKNVGWFQADNEQQSQSKALTEAQEAEYEEFRVWKHRQMLRPVQAG